MELLYHNSNILIFDLNKPGKGERRGRIDYSISTMVRDPCMKSRAAIFSLTKD